MEQTQSNSAFDKLVFALNTELDLRNKLASVFLDPRRNMNEECGYPDSISIDQYLDRYLRGDVGSKVVSILPEETWALPPDVYETEDTNYTAFEESFRELVDNLSLWSVFQTADELCGIGQFGIMVLFFSDGGQLHDPISSITSGKPDPEITLEAIRVFDQSRVSITSWDTDPKSKRYGLPLTYSVKMLDTSKILSPGTISSSLTGGTTTTVLPNTVVMGELTVHWHRVIHIVDNPTLHPVICPPRQEKVFNRLCDLNKLYGGSAEMFWRGAFPGYSFETQTGSPDLSEDEDWRKGIRSEMESFSNGLRRYLATVGMSVKSLAPQVADPSNHIRAHIEAICATLSVPYRIFMGSESGHLASTQDSGTFNKRVSRRQKATGSTHVRQLVFRLQMVGSLPVIQERNRLILKWPDLNTVTGMDKANLAQKGSDALARYVQSGSYRIIGPTSFLVKVMNFTLEEAEVIISEVMENYQVSDLAELMDVLDMGANGGMQSSLSDPNQVGGTSTQQDNRPSSADNPGHRVPDNTSK